MDHAYRPVIEEVKCVEGCGSSLLPWVGIIVALSSAAMAAMALRISNEQLKLSRIEHAAFLKQLRAVVDFSVELGLQHPPEGAQSENLRLEGNVLYLGGSAAIRFRYRIVNTGNRPAEPARLNFLVPRECRQIKWATESGGEVTGADSATVTADEELRTQTGEAIPARQMTREASRLGPEEAWIGFAQFYVDEPKPGEEASIPVSAHVWASEPMPEGVKNRRGDFELTVRPMPR